MVICMYVCVRANMRDVLNIRFCNVHVNIGLAMADPAIG